MAAARGVSRRTQARTVRRAEFAHPAATSPVTSTASEVAATPGTPTGRTRPGAARPHSPLRPRPGLTSCRGSPRTPAGSRRHWPAGTRTRNRPLQLDHHLVRGNVVPDHRAGPFRSVERLADPGRVLAEVLVERVLVLQAAHQPTARARDPHRVDRKVLLLGHPNGHRLEVLQERGAAQIAAAGPDAALQPGLIPRADLAELTARAMAREVADEGTEVDPVRCAEVDGEGVGDGYVIDRRHLHGQRMGPDEALGGDPAPARRRRPSSSAPGPPRSRCPRTRAGRPRPRISTAAPRRTPRPPDRSRWPRVPCRRSRVDAARDRGSTTDRAARS